MSWLAPDGDRPLVEGLRAASPELYDLALHLGPALRIEPLLLRNARRRFLPRTSAELEGELWFGPLISSRSAHAVVLRAGAARLLTDALAADPDAYRETLAFIREHTRHWPPLERLEQDLRLAARTGEQADLQQGLRQALQSITAETDAGRRRDMARWAKGAMPAITAGSDGPEEAGWLAQFAAATLGDPAGALGRHMAPGSALPPWLATQIPEGKGFSVGLRVGPALGRLVLEFTQASNDLPVLEFTTPAPALLHIGCESNPNQGPGWFPVWLGRRVALPSNCGSISLQTLDGRAFRLVTSQEATAETAAEQTAPRRVRIAHAPEDAELAEPLAALLREHGIEAEASGDIRPDSDWRAALTHAGADVPVVGLWTRSAARVAAAQPPPTASDAGWRGLVVRMDDAPLPEGTPGTRAVDLRGWQGDPWDQLGERLALEIEGLLEGKAPAATPAGPVFIIHTRDDTEWAVQIRGHLRAHGLDAAIEADIMEDKADWKQSLRQAVKQAAVVVGLISAGVSRWTADDLGFALASHKRLVPVLLDEVELPFPGMPPPVKLYPDTEAGWSDLLDAVRQALAAPEPEPPRWTPPPRESQPSPEAEALLNELDNPETAPKGRLAIGDELARLGDPRPGVGLAADGLPDIDWVEIPAGPFLYGEKKETRELSSFFLARYPVTNAQFQAFVDAGGYSDKRWWEGLAQKFREPEPSDWLQPNRPKVKVAWYEAMAYCRWLSEPLGYEMRLPTEFEWEKGARGSDGRAYPWGEDYKAGHANVDETAGKQGPHYLEQTTGVGLYPQGASPYGLLDMAGNVWEWCLNEYENPESSTPTGTATRPLRGGSWGYNPGIARTFIRLGRDPIFRDGRNGFRLCCASPMTHGSRAR